MRRSPATSSRHGPQAATGARSGRARGRRGRRGRRRRSGCAPRPAPSRSPDSSRHPQAVAQPDEAVFGGGSSRCRAGRRAGAPPPKKNAVEGQRHGLALQAGQPVEAAADLLLLLLYFTASETMLMLRSTPRAPSNSSPVQPTPARTAPGRRHRGAPSSTARSAALPRAVGSRGGAVRQASTSTSWVTSSRQGRVGHRRRGRRRARAARRGRTGARTPHRRRGPRAAAGSSSPSAFPRGLIGWLGLDEPGAVRVRAGVSIPTSSSSHCCLVPPRGRRASTRVAAPLSEGLGSGATPRMGGLSAQWAANARTDEVGVQLHVDGTYPGRQLPDQAPRRSTSPGAACGTRARAGVSSRLKLKAGCPGPCSHCCGRRCAGRLSLASDERRGARCTHAAPGATS